MKQPGSRIDEDEDEEDDEDEDEDDDSDFKIFLMRVVLPPPGGHVMRRWRFIYDFYDFSFFMTNLLFE